MLDINLKNQLKSLLEKVAMPIQILPVLDDSRGAREMAELLADIAPLSDKITLAEPRAPRDGERAPSFAIQRMGSEERVEFAAVPMGHEFTTLALALLQVGGHPPRMGEESAKAAKSLEGPLVFEAYISLTCQNCPEVAQALSALSAINPNIKTTIIDGGLFAKEVEERSIMAVPSVYLNGKLFAQGRMGVDEILAKLDSGAEARRAGELGRKGVFDVLVVGGGPAGAAAAIYAARKGARVGVLAERFGGQVLDTMSIENYISVPATDGPRLAAALEEHVREYGVEIMAGHRAAGIQERDGVIEVSTSAGASLSSKSVIVATGARWREMGVPGEREYRNRGVAYCPHCDGPLFKGKRVAVIGGGNSGVEAAIDLAGIAKSVVLVEFGAALRADEVLLKKLRGLGNVEILTSTQTKEVLGDGSRVTGIECESRQTGEKRLVDLDGVFVQIGLEPNTEWLRGSIDLSERGEIKVGDRGNTSMAGVFAAGDATTTPFKQIIIAAGDGAKAALGAFEEMMRRPASQA